MIILLISFRYTAIFEYQALAAQFFAKRTLQRLGHSVLTKAPWEAKVAKVRRLDSACRLPIDSMGFANTASMLRKGFQMLEQAIQNVSAERSQRERMLSWISPIKPYEDHSEVRKSLQDQHFASGQWLLGEETKFVPWKTSHDGVLLLQV